jgi:hypothetical protein
VGFVEVSGKKGVEKGKVKGKVNENERGPHAETT